jgi:hypothetical protein
MRRAVIPFAIPASLQLQILPARPAARSLA